MSVLQSITARLSASVPDSLLEKQGPDTEAGIAGSEMRYSELKPWLDACRKLGLKVKRDPNRMMIHHIATDEAGNAIGVFNEDVELVGFGFGRLPGRFFDRAGHLVVPV